MDIVAGYYHPENEGEADMQVHWHYDTAENVSIAIGTNDLKEEMISIDPEDLLALADAVRGKMKRDLIDEPDRIKAFKAKRTV